jgi:hypothetical protein
LTDTDGSPRKSGSAESDRTPWKPDSTKTDHETPWIPGSTGTDRSPWIPKSTNTGKSWQPGRYNKNDRSSGRPGSESERSPWRPSEREGDNLLGGSDLTDYDYDQFPWRPDSSAYDGTDTGRFVSMTQNANVL